MANQAPAKLTPIACATPRNDRGMQELLSVMNGNPARAAASALLAEQRPIVVCTGFPVRGRPETDGPPGAYVLIDALRMLGKNVSLASWAGALEIFGKVRSDVETIQVPVGVRASGKLSAGCAVVTVEVCGQCDDGTYRNMRHVDISPTAPRFESVFGFTSLVSFGDGGNEYGMGSAPRSFFEKWQVLPPISKAEHLVPASTSNFGVYATIKELEWASGKTLLPARDDHLSLIRELVTAGCVDGYSGEPVMLVDGEDIVQTGKLLDLMLSL